MLQCEYLTCCTVAKHHGCISLCMYNRYVYIIILKYLHIHCIHMYTYYYYALVWVLLIWHSHKTYLHSDYKSVLCMAVYSVYVAIDSNSGYTIVKSPLMYHMSITILHDSQ